MSNNKLWKNAVEIDACLADMVRGLQDLLQARNIEDPLMVGIHTGGAWVAEHLHRIMGLQAPLGRLNIAFYRDDFTRIGINPVVKPSQLTTSVDERHIILVDDVLHTGRTIRAALNELFDFGRPASVQLAVLVERSGRELPVAADVTGLRPDLAPDQHIKLIGPDPMGLVMSRARPADEGEKA